MPTSQATREAGFEDIQVGRFRIIPDGGGHEVSRDPGRKTQTGVSRGARKATYLNGRGERISAVMSDGLQTVRFVRDSRALTRSQTA